MARVRWPFKPVRQVLAIVAYIRREDRRAAEEIGRRLFALGDSLKTFPHRGRPTDDGLRQLPSVPPYVLTYEVRGDDVVILDVRHGRRLPYRHRP